MAAEETVRRKSQFSVLENFIPAKGMEEDNTSLTDASFSGMFTFQVAQTNTSELSSEGSVPKADDNRPSTSSETVSDVEVRLQEGCDCSRSCLSGLDPISIFKHRRQRSGLSINLHDMVLAHQSSLGKETFKNVRHVRTRYQFQGKSVCEGAFCYLKNCTKVNLRSIRKHFLENRVRLPGHTHPRNIPKNTLQKNTNVFTNKFINSWLLLHEPLCITDATLNTMHAAYLEQGKGLPITLFGNSQFNIYFRKEFPHLNFSEKCTTIVENKLQNILTEDVQNSIMWNSNDLLLREGVHVNQAELVIIKQENTDTISQLKSDNKLVALNAQPGLIFKQETMTNSKLDLESQCERRRTQLAHNTDSQISFIPDTVTNQSLKPDREPPETLNTRPAETGTSQSKLDPADESRKQRNQVAVSDQLDTSREAVIIELKSGTDQENVMNQLQEITTLFGDLEGAEDPQICQILSNSSRSRRRTPPAKPYVVIHVQAEVGKLIEGRTSLSPLEHVQIRQAQPKPLHSDHLGVLILIDQRKPQTETHVFINKMRNNIIQAKHFMRRYGEKHYWGNFEYLKIPIIVSESEQTLYNEYKNDEMVVEPLEYSLFIQLLSEEYPYIIFNISSTSNLDAEPGWIDMQGMMQAFVVRLIQTEEPEESEETSQEDDGDEESFMDIIKGLLTRSGKHISNDEDCSSLNNPETTQDSSSIDRNKPETVIGLPDITINQECIPLQTIAHQGVKPESNNEESSCIKRKLGPLIQKQNIVYTLKPETATSSMDLDSFQVCPSQQIQSGKCSSNNKTVVTSMDLESNSATQVIGCSNMQPELMYFQQEVRTNDGVMVQLTPYTVSINNQLYHIGKDGLHPYVACNVNSQMRKAPDQPMFYQLENDQVHSAGVNIYRPLSNEVQPVNNIYQLVEYPARTDEQFLISSSSDEFAAYQQYIDTFGGGLGEEEQPGTSHSL